MTTAEVRTRPFAALSAREHHDIDIIDDVAFANHPYHHYSWATPDYHIGLWRADELLSSIFFFVRAGTIGGRAATICGLGGVMTSPAQRGRGYASQAVRHARDLMFDQHHADLGFIVCTPEVYSFYTQHGWQLNSAPVTVQQPAGAMIWPDPTMVLLPDGEIWSQQPIDLCGLPW